MTLEERLPSVSCKRADALGHYGAGADERGGALTCAPVARPRGACQTALCRLRPRPPQVCAAMAFPLCSTRLLGALGVCATLRSTSSSTASPSSSKSLGCARVFIRTRGAVFAMRPDGRGPCRQAIPARGERHRFPRSRSASERCPMPPRRATKTAVALAATQARAVSTAYGTVHHGTAQATQARAAMSTAQAATRGQATVFRLASAEALASGSAADTVGVDTAGAANVSIDSDNDAPLAVALRRSSRVATTHATTDDDAFVARQVRRAAVARAALLARRVTGSFRFCSSHFGARTVAPVVTPNAARMPSSSPSRALPCRAGRPSRRFATWTLWRARSRTGLPSVVQRDSGYGRRARQLGAHRRDGADSRQCAAVARAAADPRRPLPAARIGARGACFERRERRGACRCHCHERRVSALPPTGSRRPRGFARAPR